MPELPEVETILSGLRQEIAGDTIKKVIVATPKLRFDLSPDFAKECENGTVTSMTRRGKYMQLHLSNANTLIIHLGMTGRFVIDKDVMAAPLPISNTSQNDGALYPGSMYYDTARKTAHDHVIFMFKSGLRLVYNDPRRFGYMLTHQTAALNQNRFLKSLGPDPFSESFNQAALLKKAHAKKISLKAFLLDQTVIAGIGNIYASEILHDAGLHPYDSTKVLHNNLQMTHKVIAATQNILTKAITLGGSTLNDYRALHGETGGFQDHFQVYGRANQRCLKAKCTGQITKQMQSNRATYFCESCQPKRQVCRETNIQDRGSKKT